jgi:hypothetical protein
MKVRMHPITMSTPVTLVFRNVSDRLVRRGQSDRHGRNPVVHSAERRIRRSMPNLSVMHSFLGQQKKADHSDRIADALVSYRAGNRADDNVSSYVGGTVTSVAVYRFMKVGYT